MPILEAQHLCKTFHKPHAEAEGVAAVRGVDLAVESGEFVAITGASGSGKSTLLHMLGGITRPSSGRVLLEGVDLAGLDDDALALVRRRRIGFVFQQHRLLPQCSAWENVLVPTLAPGAPSGDATERARSLLIAVGLDDRLAYRPGQLSVGQCQRVALARSLVNAPALLLADEPTGALDASAAEQVLDLLLKVREEHRVALLLVTHSAAVAARADRVLRLEHGKLSAQ